MPRIDNGHVGLGLGLSLSSPAVVDMRSAIITASVTPLPLPLTTFTPHSLPLLPFDATYAYGENHHARNQSAET